MSTPKEIQHVQDEVVSEFSVFGDWMERYEYIIDLGRQLPEFPDQWRTEQNRIHGCQSQVWIHSEMRGDRLHFDGVSDALIVNGLIAVLLRVYSDRRPEDILATEPDFITKIGFNAHLSPTRSNGLHAMVQDIYKRARAASPVG